MADIQMEYREYVCLLDQSCFGMQCFTDTASDLGCRSFCDSRTREKHRIPYGNCIHAEIRTKYKGCSTKSYEAETVFDPYAADEYMQVTIKGKVYDCDKVILDGAQIYPEQEDTNHDTI